MEFDVKNIKEGKRIKGTVYRVNKNDISVDINAFTEGTIYLNELTNKPVDSAAEVVKVGDEIEVIVKKVDTEKGIILLSRLAIEEMEAFETLQTYFDEDQSFEAKVLKITKGGLVLAAIGYEKLFMPLSEVSTDFIDNLDPYLNKTMKVRVIEMKRDKIIVSHKAVLKDQLKEEKRAEYKTINEGDIKEGTVQKILPYGAFVRFDQVDGLLHISELSHHNVKQVSDVLKEGQTIKVKVLKSKNNKISLSLKALQETPWEAFAKTHKVGDEVTGTVVKKMQFGMLVEVEKDVAGIVNKYDYSWNPRFNLAGELNVGDTLNVKILSIDVDNRKMTLSKKHLEYNPWEDVEVKVGEAVSGQVKELQNNGALVEVHGVNAFLPIGEIVDKRIEHPKEVLAIDDVINGIVKKFDKRNWQMVISKTDYEEKKVRDEYKQYLRSENKKDQSQTLGELFADKLKNFK